MRKRTARERRRGTATTEYTVILVALAIVVMSVVVQFGGSVKSLWAAAALDSGLDGLNIALNDSLIEDSEEPPCPFEFSSDTGRWHDPNDEYSMVSFDDASSANCS
ncbi:MAG: hypothetical protein VX498_13455 [Myxococcota bacterium]|nr:hypothetical protein [Myxococcota bacterium]